MTTAQRRPLTSKLRSTLTTRFLRVPRGARSWSLSRGFGVVFPTCWSGQKTMLHSLHGECPNCTASASRTLASFHAVKEGDSRHFGNLFLPDGPTRSLLELDAIDWEHERVELCTRRRGPGAGQVDVEAEAVKRLQPSDPALRKAAELHLTKQVMRYFCGRLDHRDAERMILSWDAADALIG